MLLQQDIRRALRENAVVDQSTDSKAPQLEIGLGCQHPMGLISTQSIVQAGHQWVRPFGEVPLEVLVLW